MRRQYNKVSFIYSFVIPNTGFFQKKNIDTDIKGGERSEKLLLLFLWACLLGTSLWDRILAANRLRLAIGGRLKVVSHIRFTAYT